MQRTICHSLSRVPFGFRSDADLVDDAPPTRRIMPFIMPTRAESVVLFEQRVDARRLTAFVDAHRARTGLQTTTLHVVLWAFARVLHERPGLNRFVAGKRLWQRRGVQLSFSMKTKKQDGAPVVVVKRAFAPGATLDDVVREVEDGVADGRRGKKQPTDVELSILLALPTFLTAAIVGLVKKLDAWGLLPRAFVDADPLFASAFVAPLHSIGLDAPYHHLYEYGSISIFAATGALQDGVLPIRFTFDERIEDGLYCARALDRLRALLEDPAGAAAHPPDDR